MNLGQGWNIYDKIRKNGYRRISLGFNWGVSHAILRRQLQISQMVT